MGGAGAPSHNYFVLALSLSCSVPNNADELVRALQSSAGNRLKKERTNTLSLEMEGPRVSSVLSLIVGVHIGATALHVLNLI